MVLANGLPTETYSDYTLNVSEAARYVGLSVSFMNRARLQGTGATYLKLGRRVVYERRALDSWLASSRRTSTSGATGR